MATGLGKTQVAVSVASKFKSVLFIVDNEKLVEQAAIAFIKEKFDESFVNHVEKIGFINYIKDGGLFALNDFKMGLIKADVFQPHGNIVLCSAQTLHKRLHLLNPDMYECVVIDEAHGFMAASFFKGATFFNPKLRLGLSATPTRLDGLLLSDLFEHIVYEYNIADGIKDGYLVEMDAIRIKTNIDLDAKDSSGKIKIKSSGGDLNLQDLSNELNSPVRNNLICNSYIKYCSGRQAIGFAVDIRHAIDLCEAFKEKGINADVISSNEELTGDSNVKWKLFKEKKIDVLFNVGLLTKGVDHDNVSCIINARPTKSLALYMQMIGRGTRTLKGIIDGIESAIERILAIKKSNKQDCIILDICDSTTRHNLINAWELDKGLNPEDRVFITQEKREKLIADRLARSMAKITHVRDKDERVSLLQLPKIKISKSLKMSESATLAQLAVIEKWGYDISLVHYSKENISEIFGKQPASRYAVDFLQNNGYDVANRFVSVAEAMAAQNEIKNRVNK